MLKADVTIMPFAKLYSLLVAKAERKGRTWEEMDQVTSWLTGYTPQELSQLEQSDTSYSFTSFIYRKSPLALTLT